jgi:uncharacterized protein YodC (DUF2158 family)
MAEFKKGDVVMLKSGGLLLTVEKVEGDGIHCVYMDYEGLHSVPVLPAEAFKRSEKDVLTLVAVHAFTEAGRERAAA